MTLKGEIRRATVYKFFKTILSKKNFETRNKGTLEEKQEESFFRSVYGWVF
jgi:hypothetical protein